MEDKKLMDYYELTMAYSDFKNNRAKDIVYFDVYFRKNIDNSGYSIFGGLEEIVEYLCELLLSGEYSIVRCSLVGLRSLCEYGAMFEDDPFLAAAQQHNLKDISFWE